MTSRVRKSKYRCMVLILGASGQDFVRLMRLRLLVVLLIGGVGIPLGIVQSNLHGLLIATLVCLSAVAGFILTRRHEPKLERLYHFLTKRV